MRIGDVAWLREGAPVLPRLLRETWGDEELPAAVREGAALPALRLRDLDGAVWTHLDSPERVSILARYLEGLVKSRILNARPGGIADRPVFGRRPIEPFSLEALPFRHRTMTVLHRATDGSAEHGAWVASVSASEFLRIRGAGIVSLLDFATVLEMGCPDAEAIVASRCLDGSWDAGVTLNAEREAVLGELDSLIEDVRSVADVDSLSANDPSWPWGPASESTIGEMLASWRAGAAAGSTEDASRTLQETRKLRDWMGAVSTESLESSLDRLLRAVLRPRQVPVLARRLGWDGNGVATLQEAADLAGVTRERIRQLESVVTQRLSRRLYCPALDAAIDCLDEAIRALEPDGAAALKDSGVVGREFLPEGVARAATLLGRAIRFQVAGDARTVLGVNERQGEALRLAARSLRNIHQIASVDELKARAEDLEEREVPVPRIRAFLEGLGRVVWLDSERTWFWLSGARGNSSVISGILKILSVCRPISVESLRNGLLRQQRTRNTVIPRRILVGLCQALGFTVRDEIVVSTWPPERPEPPLGMVESTFVEVLAANENVMGAGAFRTACIDRGMNGNSFACYLSYSPLIERLAPSVYALRGGSVDPSRVAFLRSMTPERESSVQDHGWTSDGAIWIGYRVTAGLVKCSVMGVPQAVARLVGDRQFELYAEEGARVGTLTIRGGSAWGFREFIQRRGVEVDDTIVLLVNLADGVAVLRAGAEELLERYREGDGEGPRTLLTPTQPDDAAALAEE